MFKLKKEYKKKKMKILIRLKKVFEPEKKIMDQVSVPYVSSHSFSLLIKGAKERYTGNGQPPKTMSLKINKCQTEYQRHCV